ncbi:MAG TPA: 3-isopropylmalate dehydratase [Verrucomicrobiae bacterium]|nr:3-isopropylmalate dehydratase [Verrucomicrobiae bacterium]
MSKVIRGKAYVVRDNIDTDQIIPAQYLNLVPTIPEEYVKLGSFALCGLPKDQYPTRFIPEGETQTPYTIVIGGRNFGCGSSREHAPIALGAAGCEAVVAESFARIFFRNSVATGELYPVEATARICETVKTGDEVELDLDGNTLKVLKTSNVLATKPLGEARPVIDAGGLFDFARKSGMIKAQGNHSKVTEELAANEPADD